MTSRQKCCVPLCKTTIKDGIKMHSFPLPNPSKFDGEGLERFRTWLIKIGGPIVGEDNLYIYKNRRVCHRHFEKKYYYPTNDKLTRFAIPTLHMPGVRSHPRTLMTSKASGVVEKQQQGQVDQPEQSPSTGQNPPAVPRSEMSINSGISLDTELMKPNYKSNNIDHTYSRKLHDHEDHTYSREPGDPGDPPLMDLALLVNLADHLQIDHCYNKHRMHEDHTYSRPREASDSLSGQTQFFRDIENLPIVSDVPLHGFPNPSKSDEIDRFRTWVMRIGGDIVSEENAVIFKNRRICHRHFEDRYTFPNQRLTKLAIPSLHLQGKSQSDHTYFKDAFHNDHSYFTKVTNLTPAGDTSFKREIYQRIYSAKENRQDNNLQKAANANPNGKDAEDVAKTEETKDEPSIFDDDFAPPSPSPLSPVPKIEDKSAEPKTLFSWQKPELIPADDVEEPPTVAELEEKTGISLFCDDTPAQTVPQVPETSIKEVEYRCKDCGQIIDGFQFWCVQCFGCALCGACEARGEHRHHYVLRAPPHRPYKQTQVVLATIRHQLQNENMLTQLGPDDGVKLEVKEEPREEDCGIVNTAPVEPDPLDAADPLRHEPHHTTAAEETTQRPFKRPRLADYVEKEFSTRGTPLPVKVTSRPKPNEQILINLDEVDDQVVFVTDELETDDTRGEQTEIDTDEENGEVSDEYMEIETLDDDIDSDSSVEDDDSIDIDTRIVENEDVVGDETLEVLEDVDSRIDEDTDVVTMINETDRIVEVENILSDLPARRVIREETLRARGSPESMVRTLPSEAVVELRPLSSVEIGKWTADSMKRRK